MIIETKLINLMFHNQNMALYIEKNKLNNLIDDINYMSNRWRFIFLNTCPELNRIFEKRTLHNYLFNQFDREHLFQNSFMHSISSINFSTEQSYNMKIQLFLYIILKSLKIQKQMKAKARPLFIIINDFHEFDLKRSIYRDFFHSIINNASQCNVRFIFVDNPTKFFNNDDFLKIEKMY